MTKKLSIKDVKVSEDSLYKTQKIKVGNKTIETPGKAIDIRKMPTNLKFSEEIRDIKEIYRTFTADSIKQASSTNKEQEINGQLTRYRIRDSTPNQITLTFSEFDGKYFPNEKEIELLTDINYSNSDITPLPLVPNICKIITTETIHTFKDYLKTAIKKIEELNHQPIMGIIPLSIPRDFLPDILEVYENEGINAFCVDFQGGTVSSASSKIRQLHRLLNHKRMLENSLLYTLNLSSGKLIKDKEIIPARDILSFGMGFDVIGGQHIKPRLPPSVWKRINELKNVEENKTRLFNKSDYGYYKISRSAVHQIYPKDSKVPISWLQNVKTNKNVDKVFNMEQQAIESRYLREILNENIKPLKYVEAKKQVDPKDIKLLQKLKKEE